MAGKRKPVAPAEPKHSQGHRLERLGRYLLTRLVLPVLIPVVVVGLTVLILYGLQAALRERTGPVSLSLADIDCEPPPGQTRAGFLEDVAYRADLPETVDLRDTERLASAFAQHVWVESVQSITPTPERRLRVVLTYRVAVLAVQHDERIYAVDRRGIVLPDHAVVEGLPKCSSSVRPQRGSAWDDGCVVACAKVAGYLHTHRARLHVVKMTCEQTGVLLWTFGEKRITWGSPPGGERLQEPPAVRKLQRLLGREAGSVGDLDLTR